MDTFRFLGLEILAHWVGKGDGEIRRSLQRACALSWYCLCDSCTQNYVNSEAFSFEITLCKALTGVIFRSTYSSYSPARYRENELKAEESPQHDLCKPVVLSSSVDVGNNVEQLEFWLLKRLPVFLNLCKIQSVSLGYRNFQMFHSVSLVAATN